MIPRKDAEPKEWRCHHAGCGQTFIHARFLVRHLIDLHNEGGAR